VLVGLDWRIQCRNGGENEEKQWGEVFQHEIGDFCGFCHADFTGEG